MLEGIDDVGPLAQHPRPVRTSSLRSHNLSETLEATAARWREVTLLWIQQKNCVARLPKRRPHAVEKAAAAPCQSNEIVFVLAADTAPTNRPVVAGMLRQEHVAMERCIARRPSLGIRVDNKPQEFPPIAVAQATAPNTNGVQRVTKLCREPVASALVATAALGRAPGLAAGTRSPAITLALRVARRRGLVSSGSAQRAARATPCKRRTAEARRQANSPNRSRRPRWASAD